MTDVRAFVTSVAVQQQGKGPHEYVSVWIRGQNVGTLCVGKGDGERLAAMLRAGEVCQTPPDDADDRVTDPPPRTLEEMSAIQKRIAAALDATGRKH